MRPRATNNHRARDRAANCPKWFVPGCLEYPALGILVGTTLMISRKYAEGGFAWYQMQHARVSMSDQDPDGQLVAGF